VNRDEQKLIRRAQAGDSAAFADLLQIHAQFVYNLALRTLNDAQEAEDIAQETLLRAWKALPGFRAESGFQTWLYRITINLCYTRLPRLKVESAALEPEDAVLQPQKRRRVENRLMMSELRNEIYAAVDDLPETYRLLITLRHTDGYSYKEIAGLTQMPLGTVKNVLFRARKQLQQMLASHEETVDE